MYKHVNIILDKKSRGQPVSFTDFFGYLVGDTLLKDVSFLFVAKVCQELLSSCISLLVKTNNNNDCYFSFMYTEVRQERAVALSTQSTLLICQSGVQKGASYKT